MTAQLHEILILDGKKTSMAFCPPLPDNDPLIKKDPTVIMMNTACWRGYVGTWEIRKGKFYLNKIRSQTYKLSGDYPALADWFSGTLRITLGEMMHYVHMGFGSVYEKELHILIEKGIVLKSRVIDNSNKKIDNLKLGMNNFPSQYNKFEGDDAM